VVLTSAVLRGRHRHINLRFNIRYRRPTVPAIAASVVLDRIEIGGIVREGPRLRCGGGRARYQPPGDELSRNPGRCGEFNARVDRLIERAERVR
jgi:hypothetical protein